MIILCLYTYLLLGRICVGRLLIASVLLETNTLSGRCREVGSVLDAKLMYLKGYKIRS